MQLSFSGHARRRMAERGVTQQEAEQAVAMAQLTRPADDGGTCYEYRWPDGRMLKVWLAPPDGAGRRAVKSTAWRDEGTH
jgi:hypothetical protein